MGTFDELVATGKEFAQMLSSIQENKDTDSVVSIWLFMSYILNIFFNIVP